MTLEEATIINQDASVVSMTSTSSINARHVRFPQFPLSMSSRLLSQPSIRCPHRRTQCRHFLMYTSSSNNHVDPVNLRNNNRFSLFRTKSWIQYVMTLVIRFVPILISTIGVICLLAFLINYQIALVVFNITLMIIFTIIILFIIYILVMFYLYRKYNNDNNNQPSQQSTMEYRRHTLNVSRLSINDHDFEIMSGDHDDDNECYSCRMERLNVTDVPPPYDPPPKYEELNANKLMQQQQQILRSQEFSSDVIHHSNHVIISDTSVNISNTDN